MDSYNKIQNFGVFNNGDSEYFTDKHGNVFKFKNGKDNIDSNELKLVGKIKPKKLPNDFDSVQYDKNRLAPIQAVIYNQNNKLIWEH